MCENTISDADLTINLIWFNNNVAVIKTSKERAALSAPALEAGGSNPWWESWWEALKGETKHRQSGSVFAALIVLRKSWSEQKHYSIFAGYEELSVWQQQTGAKVGLNLLTRQRASRRGTLWRVKRVREDLTWPPISRWTAASPWSTSSVQTLTLRTCF